MLARERLATLLANIKQSGMASESDCLRVFTLARELLEGRADKSGFSTLAFYGDWCLHAELNRANAKRLLAQVQAIFDRDAGGEEVDICVEVSRLLSLAGLRSELAKLLVAEGLPTFFVDSQRNWGAVARKLLTDLTHKPIVGSAFTDEDVRTAFGMKARQLRLIHEGAGDGAPILWEVRTAPGVVVTGDFLNLEDRSAFERE